MLKAGKFDDKAKHYTWETSLPVDKAFNGIKIKFKLKYTQTGGVNTYETD